MGIASVLDDASSNVSQEFLYGLLEGEGIRKLISLQSYQKPGRQRECAEKRKAASYLLLKIASNNTAVQDKICEDLGFVGVGTAVKKNGLCFSIAKVSLNKLPMLIARKMSKEPQKLGEIQQVKKLPEHDFWCYPPTKKFILTYEAIPDPLEALIGFYSVQ